MHPDIRLLTVSDIEEASRVLAGSMMTESGYVSIMPDDALRRGVLVPLISDTMRHSVEQRAAFGAIVEGAIAGVTLWARPGSYPPAPPPDGVPEPQLPPYLRDLHPDVLQGLFTYDENCVRHFPREPAWYLMYLGVHPFCQGKGIGSALLRASLDRLMQRTARAAYLETSTERNVRFYERFGFRVREAEVQLAPGDVRHWTMFRPVEGTR